MESHESLPPRLLKYCLKASMQFCSLPEQRRDLRGSVTPTQNKQTITFTLPCFKCYEKRSLNASSTLPRTKPSKAIKAFKVTMDSPWACFSQHPRLIMLYNLEK
ncbi:hypothetical protein GQX74_002473 [Glossina fuscipes]|nr:hypothetical protein GQX74_002473 [Glossina fuscipes]